MALTDTELSTFENREEHANRRILALDRNMESCNMQLKELTSMNRERVDEMGRIHQRMDRLEELIHRALSKIQAVTGVAEEIRPCSSKTIGASLSLENPGYDEI